MPADASRAREFLALARTRATNAQVSAIARETGFDVASPARPEESLSPADPVDSLAATERAAALGISDVRLYEAYWALGGTCSSFEVEAFLRVDATLPHLERLRLAQALWEFDL